MPSPPNKSLRFYPALLERLLLLVQGHLRRYFAAGYNTIRSKGWVYILIGVLVLVLQGFILIQMGQVPYCECGYVKLWHGVSYSSENSQHISDWYTFSHVIHGIVFYWLTWLIGRKRGWSVGAMFLLAILAESGWELFENTDLVINRYRSVTISLDYYGDSVLNSVSDTIFMIFGFLAARRLPIWLSVALIFVMEAAVGLFIRDNLILNIIMLIYPFDFILQWQGGG